MDFKRTDAERRIYADFGQKFQETTAVAQRQNATPEQQQTAATRLALNHVLNQAATSGQNPAQLSPDYKMVRAGQENMQQVFGQKADTIVSALSGRTAGLDLPKANTNSPDFLNLGRQGSQLAQDITHDKIVSPARLELYGNGRRGDFLTTADHQHPDKEKLVNHVLYARAGIDHAERTGKIDSFQRDTLEKKLERDVFTPASSTSLKPEFQSRMESGMKELKAEVMAEVFKKEQTIRPTIDDFYVRQGKAQTQPATATSSKQPDPPATEDPRFRAQMQGLKDTTAALNGEKSSPVRFSTDPKPEQSQSAYDLKKLDPQDQAKIEAARKVFADKLAGQPAEVTKGYMDRFDKQVQDHLKQNGGKVNFPSPQTKVSPAPDHDQQQKRGVSR